MAKDIIKNIVTFNLINVCYNKNKNCTKTSFCRGVEQGCALRLMYKGIYMSPNGKNSLDTDNVYQILF